MQITTKKVTFPNTEPWDDFLDFSRWRVPEQSVMLKRLIDNSLLFSGNWLWVVTVMTVAYGIFANWHILASFAIIGAGCRGADMLYRNACLLEAEEGRLGSSKRLKTNVPIPMSSKGWLLLFAIFILYEFDVLVYPVLLFSVGTLLMAGGHSLARPVVNEIYFIHQSATRTAQQMRPPVTDSDGFENQRGENELTFTEVDATSESSNLSNLRSRKNSS